MKIYDYYEENWGASGFFIIISALCLFILAALVFVFVKKTWHTGWGVHVTPLILCIIIVSVFTTFISIQTYSLMKFDRAYNNKNYETVTGTLVVHDIVQNDYRGNKQYDISFSVNGILFDKTNSFSEDQKKRLVTAETEIITIYYGHIGKDIVIYIVIQGDNN